MERSELKIGWSGAVSGRCRKQWSGAESGAGCRGGGTERGARITEYTA